MALGQVNVAGVSPGELRIALEKLKEDLLAGGTLEVALTTTAEETITTTDGEPITLTRKYVFV